MIDRPDVPNVDYAAIELARLNIAVTKQQIDELIARSAQTRATSGGPLKFAVIETKMANLLAEVSVEDSS